MVTRRALLVWAGILVMAALNGAVREMLLVPLFGDAPGLAASGVSLCVVVLGAAWITISWLGVCSARGAAAVGLGWLVLTVAFESGFGLLRGATWSDLLSAYTLSGGNLWPLVLATTSCAPSVAYAMRRRGLVVRGAPLPRDE